MKAYKEVHPRVVSSCMKKVSILEAMRGLNFCMLPSCLYHPPFLRTGSRESSIFGDSEPDINPISNEPQNAISSKHQDNTLSYREARVYHYRGVPPMKPTNKLQVAHPFHSFIAHINLEDHTCLATSAR